MMIASIHLLADKEVAQSELRQSDGGVNVEEWNGRTLAVLARNGPALYRHDPTLRVLCMGLGDNMSTFATVPADNQPRHSPGRGFLRNPVPLLFPPLDLSLVVGIVVSLIALVFTYDLIVGDKENGTLMLTLANSVPRHSVLYAKWLGSFISFLSGFVPVSLIVLLYMELHPGIALRTGDYLAILTIGLLSIVYAGGFFSLGLLVSCWCKDSRTSLLVLLMLWTALTLIVPGFSAYLGATVRAAPPPYEIEKQVRSVIREANMKASVMPNT